MIPVRLHPTLYSSQVHTTGNFTPPQHPVNATSEYGAACPPKKFNDFSAIGILSKQTNYVARSFPGRCMHVDKPWLGQ